MAFCPDDTPLNRRGYTITGIVQGVGFRPFVYRLAAQLSLTGWVRNTPSGVELEIQGSMLDVFETALTREAPPLAVITGIDHSALPLQEQEQGFRILPSGDGRGSVQVAPDSALCSDCLAELFDPADRRFRYPFITCTNCGPRYSIITGIPYDRPKTTMAAFPLCADCQAEYRDPGDRRFHAQPVACPVCGPQLQLLDCRGQRLADGIPVMASAIQLLEAGQILAIKGIGGYHLAVDACNEAAVRRLRQRKRRDEKPFAVMVPDLAAAHRLAQIDQQEQRLLSGPESPIVILRRSSECPVSGLVAPGNGWIGLMLPYTPIHHLLFRRDQQVGQPSQDFTALVMTSANVSDEPIAFRDGDALERLSEIADYFVVHNRPIHIRSDDSVLRVFQGRPLFYRRARGYAPRSVRLPFSVGPVLGVGAELKGAVCLAEGDQAYPSQHIGDLQNSATRQSFAEIIDHLQTILEITPQLVACDLHPDYLSSLHAADCGLPVVAVQHHHAHMAACMTENGLEGPAIGVIFDGTGHGSDGTVWGGEFLVGDYAGFRRAAHFRPVPLPGGDAAVREPWRMALACLYQAMGEAVFSMEHPILQRLTDDERQLLGAMLERGINSPPTSSCGRLFDAAAALLNLRHIVSYDGQAAIELEAVAEAGAGPAAPYPFQLTPGDAGRILDFTPMFLAMLEEQQFAVPTAEIAYRFHVTVAAASVQTCAILARETGLDRVVLSGGVFQNRLLTEMIHNDLGRLGLQVFTHRLVPPNDGGIALGQIAIAGRRIN